MKRLLIIGLVMIVLAAQGWSGELESEQKALCKQIYSIVRLSSNVLIETVEGTFYDDIGKCDRRGCLLIVSGSKGVPVDFLFDTLTTLGWKQIPGYGADGPDGTLLGMQKEKDLCIIRGSWFGDDDADTTYIPPDDFLVIILCSVSDKVDNRPPGER
jgi:hypothetical protein